MSASGFVFEGFREPIKPRAGEIRFDSGSSPVCEFTDEGDFIDKWAVDMIFNERTNQYEVLTDIQKKAQDKKEQKQEKDWYSQGANIHDRFFGANDFGRFAPNGPDPDIIKEWILKHNVGGFHTTMNQGSRNQGKSYIQEEMMDTLRKKRDKVMEDIVNSIRNMKNPFAPFGDQS